jgi:hypothetical protein
VPRFLANGAALVPALFVLVSMCGSPVPNPGGTITGTVFYDANHNAIHDSCDSDLSQAIVTVTAADGTTAQTESGSGGAFTLEHVPPGDARVTLGAEAPFAYAVTTRSPDDQPGAVVEVKNLAVVENLQLGTASRAAFDTSSVSIIGFVFMDKNENGAVDRDECGIHGSSGNSPVNAGERTTNFSDDGTFSLRGLKEVSDVQFLLGGVDKTVTGTQGFIATTDIIESGGCSITAKPNQRYATNLYEVTLGVTRGYVETASLTGVAFADRNENGVFDSGESTVGNVSVSLLPVEEGCQDFANTGYSTTQPDGRYARYGLLKGAYTLLVNANQTFDDDSLFLPQLQSPTITITGDQTLNLPLRVIPGANVFVTPFDDRNGNLTQDPGESVVSALSMCLGATPYPEGRYYYEKSPSIDGTYPGVPGPGTFACSDSGSGAAMKIGPMLPGSYPLSFNTYGGLSGAAAFVPPDPITIDLAEGQQLYYSLPIDLISTGEQLIPPGAGSAEVMDVCYSDAAWVQPPFDESNVDLNVMGGYSIDPSYPRESYAAMYAHGIYPFYGLEFNVWSTAAGLGSWVYAGLPDCGNVGGPLFAFANFKPISAVTNGTNVMQVVLQPSDTGVWAVGIPHTWTNHPLPPETMPPPSWYIFVDENYEPLARCGAFTGQCEWYN